MAEVSIPILVSPANAKKKGSSASREFKYQTFAYCLNYLRIFGTIPLWSISNAQALLSSLVSTSDMSYRTQFGATQCLVSSDLQFRSTTKFIEFKRTIMFKRLPWGPEQTFLSAKRRRNTSKLSRPNTGCQRMLNRNLRLNLSTFKENFNPKCCVASVRVGKTFTNTRYWT